MMMRCFEAGGMDVASDNSQEELNHSFNTPDYIPNPNGFYALNEDFSRPDFAEVYAGKTLKFPFQLLEKLPVGDYKVLILRRNPEDIRASMSAFMPHTPWGRDALVLDLYEEVFGGLIKSLEARGDFSITVLEYADVVRDPTTAFEKLVAAGWPIDVEKAVSQVDETLHRFKLEQK